VPEQRGAWGYLGDSAQRTDAAHPTQIKLTATYRGKNCNDLINRQTDRRYTCAFIMLFIIILYLLILFIIADNFVAI